MTVEEEDALLDELQGEHIVEDEAGAPNAGAHPSFRATVPTVGEVERVWREFWLPAICDEIEGEGKRLNLAKLKGELYDMHHVIFEAPKVYRHVTGGMTDDLRASAAGIIAAADQRVGELVHKLTEEIADLRGKLDAIKVRGEVDRVKEGLDV